MRCRRRERRGFMLLLTVMVMGLVGGLLGILALNSAYYYRARQADRLGNISQAVTASAVACAREQLATLPTTRPAEPIQLDVSAILPPKFTGSAVISFQPGDKPSLCRVSTRVQRGGRAIVAEVDIQMK